MLNWIWLGLIVGSVVYAASAVPERWRWLYDLNPLVGVIEGMRSIGIDGRAPDPALLGLDAAVAFGFLAIAYAVHTATDQRFADVI